MSQLIVTDPAYKRILEDPELAHARRKLSFQEIRLMVQHVRTAERDELERLREELAEAYWLIAQVGQVEDVNHYVPDYARSLAVFRRAREAVDKGQPA